MVYCRPATVSVARLPKVFGCVMGSSLAVRPVLPTLARGITEPLPRATQAVTTG